ncbi:putative DNA-binding transcriptional regulator AlpA [Nostoc flagelliforme CCNUN1]|uniref:Putative DNA-binding transcriptional regulator AlpA n=2 Tax=Nostoc flagelliforme TaxID=1306274 RepID=A0A2K8SP42_9NOSO|nr:helix-turn-helix domain-containing protein [Nostoc flagelliforme]AUB37244.1 putative DNA-binding transcriptional regulator AlpA [Nostoc flagelliforme CCNUN1]
MLRQNMSLDSVISPQLEAQSIKELERILSVKDFQAKLVGANGEKITIPEPIYQVLLQVVHAMASGKAISIIPQQQELTTQQAAEFLNVSRPYLIKLLEQGEIPHIKVGSHRRVRFDDVMNYKQQRDVKRDQLLTELTQMSQEAGFYE